MRQKDTCNTNGVRQARHNSQLKFQQTAKNAQRACHADLILLHTGVARVKLFTCTTVNGLRFNYEKVKNWSPAQRNKDTILYNELICNTKLQ